MDLILRIAATLLNLIGIIINPFVKLFANRNMKILPPIKEDFLKIPAIELATKIRNREIKSEEVIKAYIQRIKDVNRFLNAVITERFPEALNDAKRADEIISKTPANEILLKWPLLGVPFSVKESCGLNGQSFCVGSLPRYGIKAPCDSDPVERLRTAGAIPLLVSTNPEYCLSWETNTLINGKTNNPYDLNRTPGGSSGGEGALNGAGAIPFGIGSDIAGSIRVPSLFCGIFGHKPTGGLISIKGHYPTSTDKNFSYYLQLGPMSRYAKDLPILTSIMAGSNSYKLELHKNVFTKDIKIYYIEDEGFTLTRTPIDFDIKLSMLKAVEHFKRNGLTTERVHFNELKDQMEITLSTYFEMTDVPDMLAHPDDPKKKDNVLIEIAKHLVGQPKYSFASLCFIFIQNTNGFMSAEKRKQFVKAGEGLRKKLLELLGDNGVLFYPTFHCPAFYHKTSLTNLGGVPYTSLFNIFGFPATHVTMGLGSNKLPVGFQVAASPYQDKLCFTIAGELEAAFGGWIPPPYKN